MALWITAAQRLSSALSGVSSCELAAFVANSCDSFVHHAKGEPLGACRPALCMLRCAAECRNGYPPSMRTLSSRRPSHLRHFGTISEDNS